MRSLRNRKETSIVLVSSRRTFDILSVCADAVCVCGGPLFFEQFAFYGSGYLICVSTERDCTGQWLAALVQLAFVQLSVAPWRKGEACEVVDQP